MYYLKNSGKDIYNQLLSFLEKYKIQYQNRLDPGRSTKNSSTVFIEFVYDKTDKGKYAGLFPLVDSLRFDRPRIFEKIFTH